MKAERSSQKKTSKQRRAIISNTRSEFLRAGVDGAATSIIIFAPEFTEAMVRDPFRQHVVRNYNEIILDFFAGDNA